HYPAPLVPSTPSLHDALPIYMLHRLPSHLKMGGSESAAWKARAVKSHLVEIPAGTATLGMEHIHGDEFAWDNELGAHEVAVEELDRKSTRLNSSHQIISYAVF